jgi:hypothetical protein
LYIGREANIREGIFMDRLEGIAKRVAADKPFAQSRIEEAIGMLDYLPVDAAFDNNTEGQKAKSEVRKAVELLEHVVSMFPTPVEFKVVMGLRERPVVFDSVTDLIKWCALKGIRHDGWETKGHLRPQLLGKPTFDKLLGPMYDGPSTVRYETQEVNDTLSR